MKSGASANLGVRSRAIVRHYWQKLLVLTLGRMMVSRYGKTVRARISSIRGHDRIPAVRAAVVAHLYYVDLLPEIVACRDALPGEVPLHLTVPFDRIDEARAQARGYANLVIHPCENRGRDIAPFISLLNAGVFDSYDAVLKLHSKRSPHLRDGELRRKLLFSMLSGERNAAIRLLETFEAPETGIVGWESSYRTDPVYWMANKERVRGLVERMGAGDAMQLAFFEGSMFWFRPQALAALRELDLQPEDFEAEDRQLDGTLHHAVERVFTIAARARGFVVRDLKGRQLP